MRIIITIYFFTISIFAFDYHLKPYTMAENVTCFFGLGTESHENNGGNIVNSCYAELKEGYVVIDSGPTYAYAQQAYRVMQKRKKLPVKYVVNTSTDEAHILGNGFYKEQGATLLGPEAYNENMNITLDKKISPDAFANTRVVPLDREITKDTKIKCCTMRLNIDKIIKKNSNYLTVYIPDRKLILVGDMVYNNRIPSLENGRSLLKWIDALKKIENSSWDTIISAHGVKTKRSALINTKIYLTQLRDEIRESIKNGVSKENAIEEIKMLSFSKNKLYNVWQKKNISIAYDELKKEEVLTQPILSLPPKKEEKIKPAKIIKKKRVVKKKEIIKKKKIIKKPKPKPKPKPKKIPNIQYYSFNKAKYLAKKQHKILLLKVRSDNCPYCDKLDNIMNRNSNIRKIINKNYKVSYLNHSTTKLPLGIEIGLTPALIFIRPDTNKVVMTIKGIRAIGELVNILKEGVNDARTNGYLR